MVGPVNIVVGTKTTSAAEEPHLIYFGCDGVKAKQAAERAQASGKYTEGRIKRQVIYRWIPCAVIPFPSPSIVPASLDPAMEEPKGKAAMKRTFAPAG